MTWTSTSAPYITPPAAGEPDAWTQAGGRQQLLGVDVVAASQEAREALCLAEDGQVVRRARLILRGDEPIETAVSYWPAEWAADTALAAAEPVRGGTVRLLADLGWTAATSIEDVGAELADVDNAAAPPGAALLTIRRTLLTNAGVPFEYCVMHSWDNHRQRYVLKAG